jgi:hypothetical protein
MKKLLFVLAFFAELLIFSAQAYWAKPEDSFFIADFIKQDIDVSSDGTAKYVIEEQYEIANEEGRRIAAGYAMQYTENREQLKLISAKTIVNGKEYNLSEEMVEDKPLASAQHGFDQKRQLMLSFPHASIGAKIYLKYTVKVKPIINGFFAEDLLRDQGHYGLVKKIDINLVSALPLYIKINDPKNSLIVKQNADNSSLNISLRKPLQNQLIFEPKNSRLDNEKLTWVSVSTVNNYADYGKFFARRYESVMEQELPPLFENILSEAQKKNDEIEQINYVISSLIERIHYMGDWRSVEGSFFPRDLAKIATIGAADCKEFSVIVGAILRKLGFEVHAALIARGVDDHRLYGMPSADFNHAFLYAKGKTGDVYWLDPTNYVAMAQGMFEDIAGKRALILDPQNPRLEQTAEINPQSAIRVIDEEIAIEDNKILTVTGKISWHGEEAVQIHVNGLHYTKDMMKDILFYGLAEEHLPKKDILAFSGLNIGGRIVKDLAAEYKYRQHNKLLHTNISSGMVISIRAINDLVSRMDRQEGDLLIGSPRTLTRSIVFKGKKITKPENLNREINSPWADVKSICYHEKDDTVLKLQIVIKQRIITANELVSDRYEAFRADLLRYFNNMAVIF